MNLSIEKEMNKNKQERVTQNIRVLVRLHIIYYPKILQIRPNYRLAKLNLPHSGSMKIKLAQPSLKPTVFLSLFVAAVGVLGGGDDVGLGVLGVGDVGAGEPHEALRVHRDVLAPDDVVAQQLHRRQHLLVRSAAARVRAAALAGVAVLEVGDHPGRRVVLGGRLGLKQGEGDKIEVRSQNNLAETRIKAKSFS